MLTETLAEREMTVEGSTLKAEIKGVTANAGSATAHAVLTNTGDQDIELEFFDMTLVPEGAGGAGSSTQFNMLTITDSETGNLYTPAYTTEADCLCTDHSGPLAPGDSIPVFAQYAALSDGAATVVVNFGPMGSFENVPVTWS